MSKTTRFRIIQDTDPASPREMDNLGTMVCFHGRYDLGDKHTLHTDDFDGWEEMERHLWKACEGAVILPLYLYDHGGIALATTPFSCPWDSGQVGFVYVTQEKLDEYGMGGMEPGKVYQALRVEVEEYNQYLSGDVWGYEITDDDGDVESCWGFYGEEAARNEVKALAPKAVELGEGESICPHCGKYS